MERSVFGDNRTAAEPVVDANPDDVVVERNGAARAVPQRRVEGGAIKLHVKPLELRRPVRRKSPFETAACGPAAAGIGCRGKQGIGVGVLDAGLNACAGITT